MKFPLCLLAPALAVAVPTVRADYSFSANGRNYKVVTTARTFIAAAQDAMAQNGILARIEDATENAAVLAGIAAANIGTTASKPADSDAGGAQFLWIGGYQTSSSATPDTSRNFGWVGYSEGTDTVKSLLFTHVFWSGGKTGAAANGLFADFGRTAVSGVGGPAPDNANMPAANQRAIAMAAQAWPVSGTTKVGTAGQWNDLLEADALYYVIEFHVPPPAPTGVSATANADGSVHLAWTDPTTEETGFNVYIRDVAAAASFSYRGNLIADTTSIDVPDQGSNIFGAIPFEAGKTYEFIVSTMGNAGERDGPTVSVTMPQRVTSIIGVGGTVGAALTHQVTATTGGGATITGYALAGTLPQGLSFDTALGKVTGTPQESGVFPVSVTVNYSTGAPLIYTLTVRVNPAATGPVGTALTAATVTMGQPLVRDLAGTFTDADAPKAVRFDTVKGAIDVILYEQTTPATVANFMGYVGRSAWDGSVIHRAPANFVVQGGGYKPLAGGGGFADIVSDPAVVNEPGFTNIRGTIAMAKLGGNPNSATNEWFFSVGDNSANLDFQNGGFTVFGRASTPTLPVIDALSALPRGTYSTTVDGSSTSFSDFPHDLATAPAAIDFAHLALVNSVVPIPTVALSVVGNSAPNVCAAAFSGTSLTLTPGTTPGVTTLTVRATDLDGKTAEQPLSVTVFDTFSAWAQRQNFAAPADAGALADPDGDATANLLEFAWGTDPKAPAAPAWPAFATATVESAQYLTLTFPVQRYQSGVIYTVQASSSLVGPWAPVWTSPDGPSHPQVTAAVEDGDVTRFTIRDTTPITAPGVRFLRVAVEPLPN